MKAVCQVCMHHCALEPGQRGLCMARRNENGTASPQVLEALLPYIDAMNIDLKGFRGGGVLPPSGRQSGTG